MEDFVRLFGVNQQTRILDVGGTAVTWVDRSPHPQVTLLNLSAERAGASQISCVVGDGCCLPFKDGAFDVVFSNSVIEHLHNSENQKRFAQEIARVGRNYYVQTPNRWFVVEPHLITPFVHYFPVAVQRYLLKNFTVWGLLTRPTAAQRAEFLEEIRLLSKTEMMVLFPDALILKETVGGFCKSFMAVKLGPPLRAP
jgi:SAM-dependent methyltransferase